MEACYGRTYRPSTVVATEDCYGRDCRLLQNCYGSSTVVAMELLSGCYGGLLQKGLRSLYSKLLRSLYGGATEDCYRRTYGVGYREPYEGLQ